MVSAPGFERWIEAYTHNGRIGVLVELAFDDSFSATTGEFRRFARDMALQVAAMAPKSVEELLAQDFLKEPDVSVVEHMQALSTLLGDRLHLVRLERWVAVAEPPARDGDFDPPDAPANVMRMPQRA